MTDTRWLAERAVGDYAPDPDEGLTQTLRRVQRRQRRQRAGAVMAALAVCGATAVGVWLAYHGTRGAVPPTSPSPHATSAASDTRPRIGDTSLPAGFVPERIISSSRTRLVLQAPPGQARWTFHGNTCSVAQRWLTVQGGGGLGAAGCSLGDAYLSTNNPGSLGGNGALFSVAGGRTLPDVAVRIRVKLANGRTMTVRARHGLWLVVAQRCGDYQGTEIRSAEAIGADGRVLRKVRYQRERPPGPAARVVIGASLSPRPTLPWPPC
ncbi:MAG TPA: hypothetical protein VEQ37_07970 [Actinomycetota bacterium]|nr:hypothetical protein [Actinomycetota bacterium]